ncbi:MAG: hypothetical protein LBF08_07285 [Dysgonamonadaceae bacterium]|jgi:hypothetical protein|nr:hypothetical protein [Dysgonamonadaceae bacterium]
MKHSKNMYNTPILFIIFANPDTTAKVFKRIRQIQPKKLYVAADAPRPNKPGEAQRSAETRAIISRVDWNCEVKTLFHDRNLGLKIAVTTAISWFFEQEEMGVILEDDCLPDLSFFPFCEELLIRYKDDERIGHISGNNYLQGVIDERFSYDFSSVVHIWGWASWRRVWKNYDVNFTFWETHKDKRKMLFYNKMEEIYFSSFIHDTLNNKNGINAWSPQYYFGLRLQNQLSVYPGVNMVTNIGIGDVNATHTSKKNKKLCRPALPISFPLKHPKFISRNEVLDNKTVFFSWKRLARYLLRGIVAK